MFRTHYLNFIKKSDKKCDAYKVKTGFIKAQIFVILLLLQF